MELARRSVVDQSLLSQWQATGTDELLAGLYAARGLSPAESDLALAGLLPPEGLKGITRATGILTAAVQTGQRILFVGDFDADGATSCALGVLGLQALGVADVDYLVPNRFEYGYGLTPEIVAIAAARQPGLLITVDNGISSIEGVAEARRLGLRVLVTDHHLAGPELPEADAILNPNQPGCEFGSKSLAGVGVLFYLLMSLRAALRASGWFGPGRPEPNLAAFLDLVALGTVADVARLDRNNRILVAQGLARIRAQRCRPGVLALLRLANRAPEKAQAADLGFVVGPRLNAAGRLDDISLGVECLMAPAGVADELAAELDQLNRQRRQIGVEMEIDARAELDRLLAEGRLGEGAVCVYQPQWHQGIVGILASRIKEQLQRPVIAFADANIDNQPGCLKGSARSVSAIHIRDAIETVVSHRPELVRTFGGHAMAAGLTLAPGALPEFSELLNQEVIRRNDGLPFRPIVLSDGPLRPEQICLTVAQALIAAGPWGIGFPEPLFEGRFVVRQVRVVGENHLKMRLADPASGDEWDAIAFGQADNGLPERGSELVVAYRLEVNEWQGRASVQLNISHLWR
ncbi:MAG: single-stranded-DNA-specific exonuclease RecJ [Gammaproteobacteria bacterium]|nr:single-stranded-DNA-specific exonuclease RecJ [Gammaproteobacteria bacterium]